MSLAEVKRSLRLSGPAHDAELLSAIDAATEHVEHRLDRVFCSQTFRWSADRFPQGAIQLAQFPVQSVSEIKYDDTDGSEQTLDPARYALNLGNRQVYRTTSEAWPSTAGYQESVRLVFVAGFGEPENVPAIHKRQVLECVGIFFYDPALENSSSLDGLEKICAGYVRTGGE